MPKPKMPKVSPKDMTAKFKLIWGIPKARSYVISYFVVIFLAFTPLILSAIVFAVADSTALARTAVYLVCLFFALVAIAYSTYLTNKRIRRILAKQSTNSHPHNSYQYQQQQQNQHQNLPTHHVNSAVDAFNSEQRIYNHNNTQHSPTLASQQTMPMPHAPDYLPYAPLQGTTAESPINNIYMVPMPVPRTEPLQVRNQLPNNGPPRTRMPNPEVESPVDCIPLVPLARLPATDFHSDSAATLPEIPRIPPLEVPGAFTPARAPPPAPQAPPPPPPPAMQAPPQAPPPAPPAPPAPVASDRPTLPTAATFGLSAASAASENRDVAARNQGPTQHSGIDAFSDDDSDSDDESVKLFSFDKVKVRTDNAAEQSSPVINISGDQIMAFAGTLAVANPGNVNPMRNSTSDIPSTNDTNTTKGVSNALVSEEDPLSQPSTMSSTSKSVLEKFPVPPKSKLRLSVFPTGHKQDVVDQWIESNTQNEVPKVIPRNIGKGTDMSTSLANSELDLVIPGKFAAMEGNNIEKSSPTQASKPGASIYGESGFVASVNDSIMSMPGAAAAAAKGKQPEINGTYTATPVAAPRGLDSTNVQKTEQDELDEPLLDSSDLSLRRPTLVDYQKKADAKRKMLEELNQSQKQQQQVGVDDSRYFSAVSLPHNQAQSTAAAAAAGIPPRPFMRIDEDQEEGFLDSDSDDDEPSHVERAHVAPKSAQPNPSAAMSVPNAMGSSDWRPTSVNFDTLAAQVAMALQPATNHDSYVSTNDVGLRDSLMIKAQTPAVSPLRLEHAATSPSQKATVFNRNLLDERFDSPLAAPPRDSLISFDGLEIEEVQPSAVVQKK